MQGLQLVYIILPLGLAVVILSLVLILISQLRKEVRLSKLKVVADQYMVKVDSASKLMEGRIGQYSDQLEQRIKDGNAILSRTSAQIADLDGYSQDLSNLKSAMTTYHEALRQLADLTNKSRKELDFLQERSALFSRVQTSISSFQLKFEELSKTMFEREQRMSAVQADFQKGNDEKIAKTMAMFTAEEHIGSELFVDSIKNVSMISNKTTDILFDGHALYLAVA